MNYQLFQKTIRLSLALILAGIFSISMPTAKITAAGATWNNVVSPVSSNLYTVWGTSANNIYAGGYGIMLHYDGTSWSVVQNQCYVYQAISGSGPSDITAVGQGGPLTQFNGSQWSQSTLSTSAETGQLEQLSGNQQISSNQGWVAGNQYGVWNVSAGNYVAVGDSWGPSSTGASSPIMRRENGSWQLTPGTDATPDTGWSYQTSLKSVWGTSASSIWAAGENDTRNGPVIYHWGGTTWNTQLNLTDNSAPIVSIWGTSDSNVWAVAGDKGYGNTIARRTIWHYDGSTWTQVENYSQLNNGTLGQLPTAIWGSGPDDIWIVGENAIGSSFMHYDGNSWSPVAAPSQSATTTFRSIWGSTSGDVWAVGDGGNIVHFSASGQVVSGVVTGSQNCQGVANTSLVPTLDYSVSSTTVIKPGGTINIDWRTTSADSFKIDNAPITPVAAGQQSSFLTSSQNITLQACYSVNNKCTPLQTISIILADGISVSISVTPSNAIDPTPTSGLSTTLSATSIATNSSLQTTYYFYCNSSDSSTTYQGSGALPPDAVVTNATSLAQAMTTNCSNDYIPGVYTAKVIVVQPGVPPAEAQVTVIRTAPTITASLSASATTGTATSTTPFIPTLTATMSGNVAGPYTYTFYCNYANAGGGPNYSTSIPSSGQTSNQFTNIAAPTQTNSCSYTTSGTEYAKVVIQAGSGTTILAAEANVTITVSSVNLLSVSLSANPNSVSSSAIGVPLTAKVSGITTGTIDYYFYCQVTTSGSIPISSLATSGYNYHQLASTNTSLTTPSSNLCYYPNNTTNSNEIETAEVIVVRGGLEAFSSTSITVLSAYSLSLSATPSTGTGSVTPVFTATIAGNLATQATYSFYCNSSTAATNKTPILANGISSYLATNPCTYTTTTKNNLIIANTITAELVATVSGTTYPAYTSITVNPASVILSANPQSGSAPLNTTLTATVNLGTISSSPQIQATFYCTYSDHYQPPSSKNTSITQPCTYSSAGTYSASVIITISGVSGTFQSPLTINVDNASSVNTVSALNFQTTDNNGTDISIAQEGQTFYLTGPLAGLTIDGYPITSISISPSGSASIPGNCLQSSLCSISIQATNTMGSQTYTIAVGATKLDGTQVFTTQSLTIDIVAATKDANETLYNYSQGG